MTSDGMTRPYVVAAFFMDAEGAYQLLAVQDGANPEHAVGKAVAQYYLSGGKKPLIAAGTLQPTRETLEVGLKMLDAIDEADKAEQAKVAYLVPNVPDQNDPVHAPPPGDIAS